MRVVLSIAEFRTEISIVRAHCEVEFTLDDCVRRMRSQLLLESLPDEAAPTATTQTASSSLR